jgi:parallel beta-helix repeat protein/predicted outer membrane repeat protein
MEPRNRAERRAVGRRARKVAALSSGAVLAIGAAGTAVSVLSATPASANTPIAVTSLADDGSGTTLREAIEQANSDAGQDTITFQSGLSGTITLASDLPNITDALQIQGPGAAVITVDGASHSIFNFYEIDAAAGANAVSGLTLTHGVPANSDQSGGAVHVDGGSAAISIGDAVITDNHVSNDGGGVAFEEIAGNASVTNTTITGNSAGEGGGGLYAWGDVDGLTLTISDSTISGNTASEGGGLYVHDFATTITNTTISGNTADEDAGGITADGGSLALNSSTVSGNTAGGDGGGIDDDEATFSASYSTISGNTADGDGGGAHFYNANPTVVGTTVSGNTTTDSGGGGLFLTDDGTDSTFTMRNSTVSGNKAQYYGGGLYIIVSGPSTVYNSTISGNTASQAGGIYGGSGGLTLTQVTVTDNSATNPDSGVAVGGLQITGGSAVPGAVSSRRGHAEEAAPSKRESDKVAPEHGARTSAAAGAGEVHLVGTIVAADVGQDIGVYNQILTVQSDHSVLGTIGEGVTVDDLGGTQQGVTDPGLAPLASNGGATQTHALLPGSVALDKGPVPEPAFPGSEFDQRGEGFARVVNGVADVGAYEVQPALEPLTPAAEPLAITPKFTG